MARWAKLSSMWSSGRDEAEGDRPPPPIMTPPGGYLSVSYHVLIRLPQKKSKKTGRCVAAFKKRLENDWSSRPGSVSCSHPEKLVDELNLLPNIRTVHPPPLPLPDHVHCLLSLDRSPRRVEFTKALLGLHSSFDRSMILLQDVEGCMVGVNDAGLRMRRICQRLTEQPFGSRGIAQQYEKGSNSFGCGCPHTPNTSSRGAFRAAINNRLSQPAQPLLWSRLFLVFRSLNREVGKVGTVGTSQ